MDLDDPDAPQNFPVNLDDPDAPPLSPVNLDEPDAPPLSPVNLDDPDAPENFPVNPDSPPVSPVTESSGALRMGLRYWCCILQSRTLERKVSELQIPCLHSEHFEAQRATGTLSNS